MTAIIYPFDIQTPDDIKNRKGPVIGNLSNKSRNKEISKSKALIKAKRKEIEDLESEITSLEFGITIKNGSLNSGLKEILDIFDEFKGE